ncbi:hypothetical protein GN244_ATG10854 [Phytophthora infestans]|uniref:Uncharacterized protein n=1 Tax=Phytophthora infestans TaxID=4787 RepID=A0A833T0Y2_PHYIN|nr:hypothetical protein GN244_ATG10854 [Phytophthora infestans]KAF4146949.1 hypothetical protein GN958_ATG03836 [Phytophthora infestans]
MGHGHSIEASQEKIPELVTLLTKGRSSQKKQAATALATLADDEANHIRIAGLNGVPALVALVRDGKRRRRQTPRWHCRNFPQTMKFKGKSELLVEFKCS